MRGALALALLLAAVGSSDAQSPAGEPDYYVVAAKDIQAVIALVQAQAEEIKRLKARLEIGGCT